MQEGDRPERAPARDHREDGGRAIAGVPHDLLVLAALGDLRERGLVGQILDHARRAGAQHLGDGVGAGEVERDLLAHALDFAREGGIEAGGDGALDRAVASEQVDHAQLGQLGHGGPREVAQRLGRVERAVEGGRRVDQEFQPAAMLAHAVQREVDHDGGQQREHEADAGDGAEHGGDVFVGERQQEGDQPGERDEHEAPAWLEGGGVADREEVDQRERAAGAVGAGAQHGDQHDAPEVGDEGELEPTALSLRGDHERGGDDVGVDADGGDRGGRAHVGEQQGGRAQRPADGVQSGGGEDRGAHFAATQRIFRTSPLRRAWAHTSARHLTPPRTARTAFSPYGGTPLDGSHSILGAAEPIRTDASRRRAPARRPPFVSSSPRITYRPVDIGEAVFF